MTPRTRRRRSGSTVLRHPTLHTPDLSPRVATNLLFRVRVLFGCAAFTTGLAAVCPGWNVLAMLPTALLPVLARI
jgi:hypothetical protein